MVSNLCALHRSSSSRLQIFTSDTSSKHLDCSVWCCQVKTRRVACCRFFLIHVQTIPINTKMNITHAIMTPNATVDITVDSDAFTGKPKILTQLAPLVISGVGTVAFGPAYCFQNKCNPSLSVVKISWASSNAQFSSRPKKYRLRIGNCNQGLSLVNIFNLHSCSKFPPSISSKPLFARRRRRNAFASWDFKKFMFFIKIKFS